MPHGRDLARFRARIGMVFQQFDLFPHMTALQNVMSGPVIVKKMAQGEAEAIARELLAKVGLGGLHGALSARAVGRPAAARRHRPRPGDGARGHAVRRGDLGARSRAGGRGARRHEAARHRGHDHDRGDARDGLRARRRRPRGRDGRRPGGRAGRAEEVLLRPRTRVRRRSWRASTARSASARTEGVERNVSGEAGSDDLFRARGLPDAGALRAAQNRHPEFPGLGLRRLAEAGRRGRRGGGLGHVEERSDPGTPPSSSSSSRSARAWTSIPRSSSRPRTCGWPAPPASMRAPWPSMRSR